MTDQPSNENKITCRTCHLRGLDQTKCRLMSRRPKEPVPLSEMPPMARLELCQQQFNYIRQALILHDKQRAEMDAV